MNATIPPYPTAKLANCMWLPRILAKARLIAQGKLPEAFVRLFCSPRGMDGVFLERFGLARADIERLAELGEEAAAQAFLELPSVAQETIEKWNADAPHFGRSGYPLAEVFPIALSQRYTEVQHLQPQTIFEMLAADDDHMRKEA